jgi:hypothetical protein
LQDGEGAENYGKKFGHAGKCVKKESYVGAKAGWVVRVEECTGEVLDGRVCGRGYRLDREDCSREGLLVREEDG